MAKGSKDDEEKNKRSKDKERRTGKDSEAYQRLFERNVLIDERKKEKSKDKS